MAQAPLSDPNFLIEIVLVGKVGCGKSASGNTILSREEFESSCSFSTVTKTCERKTEVVCGREIALVDTPGLDCAEVYSYELFLSLKKETYEIIDIFLLVIQLGRFTEEQNAAVQKMEDIFGEEMRKFTMILFTHGDMLKRTSIEDYIQNAGEPLGQVVQRYGQRYHVFNNESGPPSQVTELFEKINRMRTVIHYRSYFFCSPGAKKSELVLYISMKTGLSFWIVEKELHRGILILNDGFTYLSVMEDIMDYEVKRLEERKRLEEERKRLEEERQEYKEMKRMFNMPRIYGPLWRNRREKERERLEEERERLEEERERLEERKRLEMEIFEELWSCRYVVRNRSEERKRLEQRERCEEERERWKEERKRCEDERKRREEERKRREGERKRHEEERERREEERERREEERERREEERERREEERERREEERERREEERERREEMEIIFEELFSCRYVFRRRDEEQSKRCEEGRKRHEEERKRREEERKRREEERKRREEMMEIIFGELWSYRHVERERCEEERKRREEERKRRKEERERRKEERERREEERKRREEEERKRREEEERKRREEERERREEEERKRREEEKKDDCTCM